MILLKLMKPFPNFECAAAEPVPRRARASQEPPQAFGSYSSSEPLSILVSHFALPRSLKRVEFHIFGEPRTWSIYGTRQVI